MPERMSEENARVAAADPCPDCGGALTGERIGGTWSPVKHRADQCVVYLGLRRNEMDFEGEDKRRRQARCQLEQPGRAPY